MRYDLVSVVSSLRGLPALRRMVSQLPRSFGCPVLCMAQCDSQFAADLQRESRMPVRWAEAGVALEKGVVYLSRPGTSLIVRPDGELSIAPFGAEASALNPVDNFLTSVAGRHGKRVLACVLAGFDIDGVLGAHAIKDAGGTLLVLDRATARYWGMAEPIVRAGAYDRVLTVDEVAEALRSCISSQDLLRCAEIQIVIGAFLDNALAVAGTRMGHITRRVPDSEELRILVQRGLPVDFFEHFDPIPPDASTAASRALRECDRVVVPDVMQEPFYAPHRAAAEAFGFRAIHATPLVPPRPPSPNGVMTLLYPGPHRLPDEQAGHLDTLAREAAQALAQL